MALTAAMMVAEIVGGTLFGSIALVADGWHMGTHVAALAIAGLAYLFARRHAQDTRFSLGTGKFGELAAFASAIILGMIALGIGLRIGAAALHPVAIHFREAIPIAALGSCVNLASAWLLRDEHTITVMTHRSRPCDIMRTIMHHARTITTSICARPMSMCWPMR